jgi:cellulose/xylan binding protein with CBM9 domain
MRSLLKLAVVPILFVSFAIQAAAPVTAPNGARDLMQAGTGSYGCTAADIAHYVARRAAGPMKIDGHLDEPSWQMAEKSPRFVDMVSGAPGFYDTRAAVLWDDDYLYVGLWLEEPYVEAHLTENGSLIFQENDAEVFIDGGDAYSEFETNALGTTYQVFFIWQDAYKPGSIFDVPEFDVLKNHALTFGGDYDRQAASFWKGTHPRGLRWAFLNREIPGLRSAVHVDGKINDNSQADKGWTVELAFPWKSMQALAAGRSLPPHDGDTWRIFFGRFELLRPEGQELEPHPAWVWSRHAVYDTHIPECFPYIQMSSQPVGQR